MIDAILARAFEALFNGGHSAVIALLSIFAALLIFERRRLLKEIERKDDKIDTIMSDYYKGNLTVTEALNSIKLALYEIRLKI